MDKGRFGRDGPGHELGTHQMDRRDGRRRGQQALVGRHGVDRARHLVAILGRVVLALVSFARIAGQPMGSVVVVCLKAMPCSMGQTKGLQPCQ